MPMLKNVGGGFDMIFRYVMMLCMVYAMLNPYLVIANTYTAEQKNVIAQLEAYIDGLNNVYIRFEQEVSGQDTLRNGYLLIKKPKMKWVYGPPIPSILIMKGNDVTFYDVDLDEISYVKNDNPIISMFTQKKLKLACIASLIDYKLDDLGKIEASFAIHDDICQKDKKNETSRENGILTIQAVQKPFYVQSIAISSADQGDMTIFLKSVKKQNISDEEFMDTSILRPIS